VRIRVLVATALALGCAGAGGHPAAQPPRWVRDARTGLVVRVPDGWSLVPTGLAESSLLSSFAPANRPRFVLGLIQNAAVADRRVVTVFALASANPGLPVPGTSPTACAELLAHARAFESRAESVGTRTIGNREFCAYRSEHPDGGTVRLWSTVSEFDVLDLMTQNAAGESAPVDEVLEAMSFTKAEPVPLQGESSPRIRDARTGLRLDVPAGWSALPQELIRASSEATLLEPSSAGRTVFMLVRDETFASDAADVVGFLWEPLDERTVLPDSLDEICKLMLPLVRSEDAHAALEPPRSIGGVSFCAFRFSSGGQRLLLFAAVRDGLVLRFQAAIASPDLAPLDALLDAVEFE
jgi:hypothetical protein